MQIARLGHDYDSLPRPSRSGHASQFQVDVQGRQGIQPHQHQSSHNRDEKFDEYTPRSRLPQVDATIRNTQLSSRQQPFQPTRSIRPTESNHGLHPGQFQSTFSREPQAAKYQVQAVYYTEPQLTAYRNLQSAPSYYSDPRQIAIMPTIRASNRVQFVATRYAERPQGRTQIIHPGEPHHFGSRADYELGEIQCTLCRCNNPDSHGDAYTMLNSPRGCDTNGQPIDWQEAKRRMLNHYGRDQISHAEEIAAASYVFDAQTTQLVLETDQELKMRVEQGRGISVNTSQNNINWHNIDGHAKPYLTQEGAKTQYKYGGGDA
jgi:hypothetical protein